MVNFRGFFLPKEKDSNEDQADSDGESESDNDDFENPDYSDIIQIARGKYQSYAPSKIRYAAEKLQELEERNGSFILKEEKVIRARFDSTFTQPWWMVEVIEINTGSRTQRTEKIPSYSIRCDDWVDKSLLSLFMTKGCCVHEQHVASFLEFIEGRKLRPTFVDLPGNLREFASSSEINNEIADQIRTSFASRPTGKAFLVPELTKVAHRLFPRHVSTLFSSTSLEVLQDIEQTLQSEPWILGFQAVVQETFGIWGCEVKLMAFINCDLLETMPVVQRDALYIYNALCKLIYKYGDTYEPVWRLQHKKWYDVPFTPGAYRVTNWEESLAYLSEINVAKTTGNNYCERGSHVFLPHIRGYEQTIVRSICKIMKERPWVGSMEIDEKVFGGDEDQVKAAQAMTTSPVVVLSGKGGCGKTHVVSTVLSGALKVKRSQMPEEEQLTMQDECTTTQRCFDDSQNVPDRPSPVTVASCSAPETPQKKNTVSQNSEMPQDQMERPDPCGDAVLLTAPTGRAASILGKRTGLQSYTLHSVIFSYLRWLKEVKNGENHSAWKFSEVKLLVCDESSLISVKPFSTLINILMKKASLQQIILLGDKNQLPSIEPGNFLSDVYHALESYGSSITLRTNHRAESQLIVENASKISHQEMPHFPEDPKRGFISLCCRSKQASGEGTSDDMVVTQVVRDLLGNKISAVTLPEPQQSQFIAFRRMDCLNINELCAQHYNQHSIKTPKGELDFQPGDKVCVRKNVVCFDAYTEKEVKLCNGEIFFIKEVIDEEDNHNKKTTYFALDDGERIVKVDLKMLKNAKLCHAWARTIHTYQGSEIDTVVYVLGSPIYQDWHHVYTAVTRGVRQVVVVHDPNHLKKVVMENKPYQRRTSLKEFLIDDLAKPSVSDEAESDPETEVLTPSPSNLTVCPGRDKDDDDDDVFHSPSLDNRNPTFGHPVIGESLEVAQLSCSAATSTTTTSNYKTWEDEFKDECDDEVLAWALESSQQVNNTSCPDPQGLSLTRCADNYKPSENAMNGSSEYLLARTDPHNNAITNGDFQIARSNLNIKKESRYTMECRMEESSHSSVVQNGNQSTVLSGDFLPSRNGVRVKTEKQEEAECAMVECSGQFFGSLSTLACSGRNTFSSTVHQSSPVTSSPKTCSRRFSEGSGFPTPPQTPPNVIKPTGFSPSHLSNTFPRMSGSKRTQFRNSGGTPAKSKRRSFTARFNSTCGLCKKSISAGVDEITHFDNGSTNPWVHQKCVQNK